MSGAALNRGYRTAVAAGAFPLATGVAIFLLWLATRWDGLMTAGVVTLVAGACVVLAGAVALAGHCRREQGTPVLPKLGAAVLLLVNFPVAGGIVATVVVLETAYTVTVRNDSTRSLGEVRILGPGCDVDLGSVSPGATVQRRLWFHGDGELVLRATSGATARQQVIDGYVTHDLGGELTVTVTPEGTITCTSGRR